MSTVAKAVKDVSDHPTKMGVTTPNNPKEQQADVDRKMKFYGVISALGEGKYPSNKQIDQILRYTLENSPIDQSKLSSDGKLLINDTQKIIDTLRKMVVDKNEDELFQSFLYNTRKVDTEHVKGKLSEVGPNASKEDAQSDADQAAEHLRTLGKLIWTNSEFRKIMTDLSFLARDVAADAAAHGADMAAQAADKARPAEHELNQVDQTAPDNQWVGPDGQTRSHNEPVPDTGLQGKKEELQARRDQAVNKKDELKNAASDQASQAQNAAGEHANRVQNATQNAPGPNDPVNDPNGPTDAQKQAGQNAAADSAQDAKNTAAQKKDQLMAKIPQEHKDKANEQIGKAKDYANEKFDPERRERFIYRLKKVVVEQQRHKDYQTAVDFFLDRAETYHGHAKDVTKQSNSKSGALTGDSNFQTATDNLRTLLERFANGQSMQPIFDAVDQLYSDAQNDERLKRWFGELDTYIRNVLTEPGYIMEETCDQEGARLRDTGREFWEGKYAGHKDNFFNQVQRFFTAYADDDLNNELGDHVKKLTRDLFLNGEGDLTFKTQLWNDIRGVILPELVKKVGYVPIPRIEYYDSALELVIENLTLEASNLLPNSILIEAHNHFKLSAYSAIPNRNKHEIAISFDQLQSDLRDVGFYFKKKQGFPKISDSGVADVFIGGKGISGKIAISSSDRKGHVFKTDSVKIKIDTLKFAIRDSKHSILYATLRPLASTLIKKQVAKAIEGAIRSGLEQLDAQLVDIRDRVDSQTRSGASKTDAYKNAFTEKKEAGKREAEQKKREAEEKSKDAHFAIVMKKEDQHVNYVSPVSITEKQAHVQSKVNASQSHGWKSPAFDII
ncbi:uncharacterized protein L969DRAFT_17670 [Mixia osmundae IAM 14324]|nr:uncharacterized protein L969DRAFT_17670 [Mixia osmundae IAM 14324]KEI39762.1 hypothetical protein L969DRAFT_17670 [Mixia osmundae IAM 14324]